MGISGILDSVRRFFFLFCCATLALSFAIPDFSPLLCQEPPPPAAPQQPAPAPPAPAPAVVVIDPAHGGADTGARGEHGMQEKDVVLTLARILRNELQRQGLQVVMTREADTDRSLDDRAAAGNAPRRGIFISLHVATVGSPGAARAYSYPALPGAAKASAQGIRLVPWERAQEPFAESSRQLAELVQVQLGQKLRGSPEVPAAAGVRQLRIVAAPAIAVELSNISAEKGALERLGPALATAIARGVTDYLAAGGGGAR